MDDAHVRVIGDALAMGLNFLLFWINARMAKAAAINGRFPDVVFNVLIALFWLTLAHAWLVRILGR